MKYFIGTVIGVVFAVIVAALVIVGSPAHARQVRQDEQRLNDLSNIQWQITQYWQTKSKLPASLNDLKDDLSGYRVPIDPATAAAYEYSATASLSFKLCATFALEANDRTGTGKGGYAVPATFYGGSESDTWNHAADHTCFDRTIDPERYKPVSGGKLPALEVP